MPFWLQLTLALSPALLVVGYVPTGFGVSAWITVPVGIVAAVAVVLIVGRPLRVPER